MVTVLRLGLTRTCRRHRAARTTKSPQSKDQPDCSGGGEGARPRASSRGPAAGSGVGRVGPGRGQPRAEGLPAVAGEVAKVGVEPGPGVRGGAAGRQGADGALEGVGVLDAPLTDLVRVLRPARAGERYVPPASLLHPSAVKILSRRTRLPVYGSLMQGRGAAGVVYGGMGAGETSPRRCACP